MPANEEVPNSADGQPFTRTEHLVAQLWAEVLQRSEPIGASDDFFALGGDSMTMVLLEFRTMEEFSVELPPGAVLSAPTIRELSQLIESTLEHRGATAPSNSLAAPSAGRG